MPQKWSALVSSHCAATLRYTRSSPEQGKSSSCRGEERQVRNWKRKRETAKRRREKKGEEGRRREGKMTDSDQLYEALGDGEANEETTVPESQKIGRHQTHDGSASSTKTPGLFQKRLASSTKYLPEGLRNAYERSSSWFNADRDQEGHGRLGKVFLMIILVLLCSVL